LGKKNAGRECLRVVSSIHISTKGKEKIWREGTRTAGGKNDKGKKGFHGNKGGVVEVQNDGK